MMIIYIPRSSTIFGLVVSISTKPPHRPALLAEALFAAAVVALLTVRRGNAQSLRCTTGSSQAGRVGMTHVVWDSLSQNGYGKDGDR